MSLTETIQPKSDTPTILHLSPSKRRRIAPKQPPHEGVSKQHEPTAAEIWQWTLTSEAIAPCFVKDVFEMREHPVKDADFFWLGRIPCRSVRIVGMLVGVQVWEKRTVYSVDDGTSVIDCFHRHSVVPTSPNKLRNTKPKPTIVAVVELPKPIADVGTTVRVVGRVSRWHDTRQINVDHIDCCTSMNEEPSHWLAVLALHETSYDLTGPFIMPKHAPSNSAAPRGETDPQTPGARSTTAASVSISTPSAYSASCSSAPTSPTKLIHPKDHQSPLKLRHPSRLHSRDLTSNTFRIYVKHYMDHAPSTSPATEPESDSENIPSTPTKCRATRSIHMLDESSTPRQTRPLPDHQQERTPMSSGNRDSETHPVMHLTKEEASPMLGFTLSHLRRVPPLAQLARRVVHAEAKRRAREEREKSRPKVQGQSQEPKKVSRGEQEREKALAKLPADKVAAKMKRLFGWAIVKLYEEGAIVLFDGPIRPVHVLEHPSSSLLWKVNSSTASTTADSTVFSVGGISVDGIDGEEDDGYLSDPVADEEAYVPLTPAYLAPYIEKAIRVIMAHSSSSHPTTSSSNKPSSKPPSATSKPSYAPPPGPTLSELAAFLRRTDGRWGRVGEWAVGEALAWLNDRERVWCVGGGRWEVCL